MNKRVVVIVALAVSSLVVWLALLPSAPAVRAEGGMALAPTATATRAAAPTGPAITLTRAANVRGGPGVVYAIVKAGKTGEVFAITGKAQASDGLWYQVTLSGGKKGWIRADLGRTSGPVAGVTVVTSIPPTPKAAVAPTRAPAARLSGILLYSNANMDANQWELWEYNMASGARRMINPWRTEVDFSKDGRQLAYYNWSPESGPQNEGIWIANSDYTGGRKLIPGGLYPSFSPGADRLAVMGDQIYIINSDGGGLRPLIEGEYPDWSPVDNRIAFRNCFGGDCGIWITDADAGGRTRVTNGGSDGQPAWSPDGRKLAFISQDEGNFEIYTVNPDGSGRTRLTNRPASDGLPVWAPDGSWLAWRSDEGGTWGIWVMRSDGSGQRRLFDAPVLQHWFFEKMGWRR